MRLLLIGVVLTLGCRDRGTLPTVPRTENDPPVRDTTLLDTFDDTDGVDTLVADTDTDSDASDPPTADTAGGGPTDPPVGPTADTADTADTDGAPQSTADTGTDTTDTADTAMLAVGCSYDVAPTAWALPGADYAGDESLRRVGEQTLDCTNGDRPASVVADIDGDGLPELVVTDLCTAGGGGSVGETEWLVYDNTGSGFATAAVDWPIPGATFGGAETFDTPAALLQCSSTAQPTYGLLDLDGDRRPELIVTDECNPGGGGTVGEQHWLVYTNSGTGFSSTPGLWPTPGGRYAGDETFDLLDNSRDCAASDRPGFSLLDLDGDGDLDLVITSTCDDPTVGETHWRWHKNLGLGFADFAGTFLLPGAQHVGDGTFAALSSTASCAPGDERPAYALRDMNGDGLPDLVVTDDCNPAGDVGETRWEVYLNEIIGMASTPIAWSVPGDQVPGPDSAIGVDQDGGCGGGLSQPRLAVRDIDHDRRPDLLILDTCTPAGAVGETEWLWHRNTGAGFDPVGGSWGLPGAGFIGAESFDRLADVRDCAAAAGPTYGLLDLDGDGGDELVVSDVCTDTVVGEQSWLVFTVAGPRACRP